MLAEVFLRLSLSNRYNHSLADFLQFARVTEVANAYCLRREYTPVDKLSEKSRS